MGWKERSLIQLPIDRSERTVGHYVRYILFDVGECMSAVGYSDPGQLLKQLDLDALRVQDESLRARLMALEAGPATKPARMELGKRLLEVRMQATATHCWWAETELKAGRESVAWTYLMDAQALLTDLKFLKHLAEGKGPELAFTLRQRGAEAGNAKDKEARDWTVAKWHAHKAEYESKQKFAEDYRVEVKKVLGYDVTVKTITERWLKGEKATKTTPQR